MEKHSTPMQILLAACLAITACLATPTPARAADAPLTVFDAASLKDSMDAAALAFQRENGTKVRVPYAGSSALAGQTEEGTQAADSVFPASSYRAGSGEGLVR